MSDGAGMNNGGYGPYGGPGGQPGQVPGHLPQVSAEPDWAAMADRAEREQRRRRRLRALLFGVLAVVVVGGLTATAVVVAGGKDDPPAPGPTASQSGTARPAPAGSGGADPADPSQPIWELATDGAPVDPATFFPDETLTIDGRPWTRRSAATTEPCWNATIGGLGDVIAGQACREVLRATYVSGDSAVVVGVAVFDHKLQAETAMKKYRGHIKGLKADGVADFCQAVGCTSTHATLGRYAYFTASGSAKVGGTAADQAATDAAPDFAKHLKQTLLARAAAAGKH